MKNLVLRAITANVNLGNVYDGSVGITLNVNGSLVSGVIVSRKEYFEISQNKLVKPFNDAIIKELEELGREYDEADLENIDLMYLKDAAYFTGSQRIPLQGGTVIAVNIDDICSYNFGSLIVN